MFPLQIDIFILVFIQCVAIQGKAIIADITCQIQGILCVNFVCEPQVRIPVQEGDKVEEIRDGARVIMIKVTPPGGKPYYLLDTSGTGNWMRRESLDDGVRVPMWPIITFD